MDDSRIVDLYWVRNESAITETASKYGKYCYAIAYNILCDKEDADGNVNDTYLGAWNAMPPHRPSVLRTFLGEITRRVSLKKWEIVIETNVEATKYPLPLTSFRNVCPQTSR